MLLCKNTHFITGISAATRKWNKYILKKKFRWLNLGSASSVEVGFIIEHARTGGEVGMRLHLRDGR